MVNWASRAFQFILNAWPLKYWHENDTHWFEEYGRGCGL